MERAVASPPKPSTVSPERPGVYLSGRLGMAEQLFPAVTAPVAYLGLRGYRFIGAFWWRDAGWDLVHHLWGNPIRPFLPTSSFGCLLFDALIGLWFFAGPPSVYPGRSGMPSG